MAGEIFCFFVGTVVIWIGAVLALWGRFVLLQGKSRRFLVFMRRACAIFLGFPSGRAYAPVTARLLACNSDIAEGSFKLLTGLRWGGARKI